MEKVNANSMCDAGVIRRPSNLEEAFAHGTYAVSCRNSLGELQWEDTVNNVVTYEGKNLALNTFLAGSGYTVVGPFIGLISSISYGAGPVIGDTMGSHAGWYEVSATTYFPTVAARLTTNANWAASSNGTKALTAPVSFTIITNPGIVKGCFLVYGSGAVATLGSALGTLYSAGTFTGGDKTVGVGDTLQVSYTAGL